MIDAYSAAGVREVAGGTLSAGWKRISPGAAPSSYTDPGGAPVETAMRARLTAMRADEQSVGSERSDSSVDVLQTYRLVASVTITADDEVLHVASGRRFSVLAIESPPTGGYGLCQAVVQEMA